MSELYCAECGRELKPMPPEVLRERIAEYERTYGKFGALPLEVACDDCRIDPDNEPHAVEELVQQAHQMKLLGEGA